MSLAINRIREILEQRANDIKFKNVSDKLIDAYRILLTKEKPEIKKSWWVQIIVNDLCNINEVYKPKLTFDELKTFINISKKS